MRLIKCALVCVIVSGCTESPTESTEPSATPSVTPVVAATSAAVASPAAAVATKEAAAKAPAKKSMAKCLGPDIPLVDGASIVGQFYTLGHYNDVTVRLVTDFAPKTLVLDLKPARTGSSYPKATVSISSKGDPEQKELGEIVLKKEAVEEYKLEGLAAGEYYVRIHYGATEPEGTARPALLIKSVELKK